MQTNKNPWTAWIKLGGVPPSVSPVLQLMSRHVAEYEACLAAVAALSGRMMTEVEAALDERPACDRIDALKAIEHAILGGWLCRKCFRPRGTRPNGDNGIEFEIELNLVGSCACH